jgi:hypothetical protein
MGKSTDQNNIDGREGTAMLRTERGRSRRLPRPQTTREVVSLHSNYNSPQQKKNSRVFEVVHCNCRNEEVQLELHVVKKTKRETTSSFVGKKSKSNLEGATNFIKNYQLDGGLCLLPSQGLERYSEQKMATYTHIARRFLV